MKKYIKLSHYLLGLALSIAIVSCDDAEYKESSEGLYLAETNTKALVAKSITQAEDGTYTMTVTPRLVGKATSDVTIKLGLLEDAIETYNTRNNSSLVTVPSSLVEFSTTDVVIRAGETLAPSVSIKVNKLSKEDLVSGKKFAIPVGIVEANGQSLIADAHVMIFRLQQLPIVSVPVVNKYNNLKFNMRQDYDLTQWSVEFCVNMDKLGTSVGKWNNQAMFAAFAPDGKDGEIYTRFGDAPIKGNIFQVKNQGTQMNSKTEFSVDKWYHIALVCNGAKISLYVNGELDNEVAVTGKVTSLGKDKFQFGNTDYLVANAMLSEVRFWTKAISQSQIKENMYSIDPATDGLEAYWKLDEGKGNNFQDYTEHGNNGVSAGNTEWKHDVRIDGK